MKTLLQLNDVNLTLKNGKTILHNVSCEIREGEFVVLVGSNGSGKSTLIKLINQTYLIKKHAIFFKGEPLKNLTLKQRTNEIVTLTQLVKDSLFVHLTVAENARLIANIRSNSKLKEYFERFNPALSSHLKTLVSDLSGGEQQQLAFALYLTKKPSLLLLDEHTSALDPKTADKIMQLTNHYVREHGLTCIMTTHNLEFASQYGDRLIAMKNGHLIQTTHAQNFQEHKTHFLNQCYA